MSSVIVIGAGVAGLAAARRLREHGRRTVVIEAARRPGGRAWTRHPPELGGQPFDEGAVWLHAADRNPLVPLARAAGFALTDADAVSSGRTWVDGRWATHTERAALHATWSRFEAQADRLLGSSPTGDAALAAVAESMGENEPWALTVEAWEGPIIDAAPAGQLSLKDWQCHRLSGGNLMLARGMGTFIEQTIAQGIDVHYSLAARAVCWNAPGGVTVETTVGKIEAAACIVTVSTGVLQGDAIRFVPELPAATRDAIHGLPMGNAVKVALRASGPDRLDLADFCTIDRRIESRREKAVAVNAWPFGRDHVIAWIGADAATAIAGKGDAAAADLVCEHLRTMFGTRADRLFACSPPVVTRWADDPLVRGAYAYAVPGKAGARAALAGFAGNDRLLFAGEATHPTLAGTVGGAYLTGREAADRLHAALRGRGEA